MEAAVIHEFRILEARPRPEGNGMSVSVRSVGDVQILEPAGALTLGRGSLAKPLDLQGQPVADLGTTLEELLGQGHTRILLNLHRVNFMDSAGLGELVGFFHAFLPVPGSNVGPSCELHSALYGTAMLLANCRTVAHGKRSYLRKKRPMKRNLFRVVTTLLLLIVSNVAAQEPPVETQSSTDGGVEGSDAEPSQHGL